MQKRPISTIIFGILNIGFGAMSWVELILFEPLSHLSKTAGAHSAARALAGDPSQAHWLWITGLIDSIAGVALIAGGIGLLAGKSWGRSASVGWGVFDIIFTLARIPLNYGSARAAAAGFTSSASMVKGMALAVTFFGTALGLVYPILLLYFMNRLKRTCPPS